ncbi:MAG: MarR family transcriptional regulator [Phycisphaerales bacterium]|nr:MarR family transcriptional regulator [Phycisphaerales bacterium]
MLEPDIRKYPTLDRQVCVAKCPECGRVQFELEQLQQWTPNIEGLASHLAGTSNLGIATSLVASRCWRLGTIHRNDVYREVFFARGLTWDDAKDVVTQADRLSKSAAPLLLVPALIPDTSLWRRFIPACAALTEISVLTSSALQVDWNSLLQIPITCAMESSGGGLPNQTGEEALRAIVLTDAERTVLQALAQKKDSTFTLVELEDAAGYRKHTTSKAVKRLIDLGLAVRPGRTKRKGLGITSFGSAYLERSCSDALPAENA